jgi:hypothetical protein
MNFEDWQKVWQDEPAPLPEDVKAILTDVRRKARAFDRSIVWRDLREVVAAVIVAVAFGWTGLAADKEGVSPWLCWIAAIIPLGVAGFLLVDRQRMRRSRPTGERTVLAAIDQALIEVRHQARLLRSVVWWYILPLGVATLLFLAFVLGQAPLPIAARATAGAVMAFVIVAINIRVWWLNHLAVRRHLEPRIRELESQRLGLVALEA